MATLDLVDLLKRQSEEVIDIADKVSLSKPEIISGLKVFARSPSADSIAGLGGSLHLERAKVVPEGSQQLRGNMVVDTYLDEIRLHASYADGDYRGLFYPLSLNETNKWHRIAAIRGNCSSNIVASGAAPLIACRSMVIFSSQPFSIKNQQNIASVTKLAGDEATYRITFKVPAADSNYAVSAFMKHDVSDNSLVSAINPANNTKTKDYIDIRLTFTNESTSGTRHSTDVTVCTFY